MGVVYGNPEVTPGGRALKFYASVRIEVRKSENLKSGSEQYGNRVKCKVVKNKVAPPFKTAEFDILFGKGINKTGEILDLGVELELIEKSGAWFSYNGERIGQGRDNARKFLDDHPEIRDEIEEKITEHKSELDYSMTEADELDSSDEEDDGFDISVLDIK